MLSSSPGTRRTFWLFPGVASDPSKLCPWTCRRAWEPCSGPEFIETLLAMLWPCAVWAASFGHLGLQGAGQIEVSPDGIVVGTSPEGHKEMPDGVGKGDPPVTLEEHHTQAVEDPSGHQLPDALGVGLSGRTRVGARVREAAAKAESPLPPHPHTPKRKETWMASQPRCLGRRSQHVLSILSNLILRCYHFYQNLEDYSGFTAAKFDVYCITPFLKGIQVRDEEL